MAAQLALPATKIPAGASKFCSYVETLKPTYHGPSIGSPMRTPSRAHGAPALLFTENELLKAEKCFSHTLVLKFLWSRSSLGLIKIHVRSNYMYTKDGDSEIPTVGILDQKNTMVKLTNEENVLAREAREMEGYSYRMLRWTADFNCKEESPLAPTWIYLPEL